MRRLITIMLFFVSTNLLGQTDSSYIKYYNLGNEADKQIYFKNNDSALTCYKLAFNTVKYIHFSKLIRALRLTIKQKDYEFAVKCTKLYIIQGNDPQNLENKFYKKIRESTYYKTVLDSIQIWEKNKIQKIIPEYKAAIDSLVYVDQKIIRNSRSATGEYNIDKSSLPKNLFLLDSLIFADLLALIEKYGFPTEMSVGIESFFKVQIIYHHNIRLPQNSKYIDLAQKALFEGAYIPSNYAWMYDQSLKLIGEKPYFYYGVVSTSNLSEDEKKMINERRKAWGIKPLEAQKVIKRGKTIIQKNIW